MDLQRAYETLGLTRDASEEEVESTFDRLRDDYRARAERASTSAIQRRFDEAWLELEAARAVIRSSLALRGAGPDLDDALALAHAVLGLDAGASPLDVASAYVSLCEELERDLETAPTEALRRRCHEARAEVDEAYRACIASLAPETVPEMGDGSYQVQMSSAPFEGEVAEERELVIVAPEEPDEGAARGSGAVRSRRRGRGVLRLVGATSGLVLLAGVGVLGFQLATGTDVIAEVRALIPARPDPRIVQAQGDADLARQRVTDERAAIVARAEEARARVTRLERELTAAGSEPERQRLREELAGARARRAVAIDLAEFAEKYVFEGSDMALAFGRIEVGQELAQASHKKRALRAFEEAETLIEAALTRIDDAEHALGARSEAVAARDAWYELQEASALDDSPAAREGDMVLAGALGSLAGGTFGAAAGELERASQLYRTALDDGRREVASAPPPAPVAAVTLEVGPDPVALAVDLAIEEATALQQAESGPPPVSAPPPGLARRSTIKLVTVGDVSERFRIDRTEVRVDEYRICVRAGLCTPPTASLGCNWERSGRGDHPVNCVDWIQARSYCEWVGKRLPSDAEWERAARGDDGRRYPWGEVLPSCDNAIVGGDLGPGCGRDSTWPVASVDAGRSPDGIFDMAGNVREWTGDRDPSDATRRVVRGGAWNVRLSEETWRSSSRAQRREEGLGFRCADDAPPS